MITLEDINQRVNAQGLQWEVHQAGTHSLAVWDRSEERMRLFLNTEHLAEHLACIEREKASTDGLTVEAQMRVWVRTRLKAKDMTGYGHDHAQGGHA